MKLVALFLLVATANAASLTCKRGFTGNGATDDGACASSGKRYPDNPSNPATVYGAATNDDCNTADHACLSATWVGGQKSAYGCYGNAAVAGAKGASQILKAKQIIIDECKKDAACLAANANGEPTEWSVCSANDCNVCSAADASAAATTAPTVVMAIMLVAGSISQWLVL